MNQMKTRPFSKGRCVQIISQILVRHVLSTIVLITLTGCSVLPASSIKPGVSTVDQTFKAMGKPDMAWRDSQGQVIQAAWTTQPASYVTFMVYFSDKGSVIKVEQVLNERHFAMVKNGMEGEDVLKILGPYRSVDHFSGLHQIDWNYGYCSDSDGREVYSVSFDDRTLKVTGGITTPDPLFSLGSNEEAMCVPYMGQENAFVR